MYTRLMAMIRGRASLRWLLSAWFTIILFFTLLVLGAGIYFMIGRYLVRSGAARLRTMAITGLNRIADEARDDSELENNPTIRNPFNAPLDLEAQAQRMADLIGSRQLLVRIMNPDGTLLGESTSIRKAPDATPDQIALLKNMFDDFTRSQQGRRKVLRQGVNYLVSKSGRRWQVLLLPMQHGGQLVGIMELAQPFREQDELLTTVGRYLIGGGVLAILVGLVACYSLSRTIALPLETLADTTRRVADGDLTARAAIGAGATEINEVAESFNDMVGRLETSFDAQRRFIADASHELKTPLTSIGGMAELLRLGVADGVPQNRERALDTIEREVDKMNRLVSDLLMLSRNEARAEVQVETGPVDCHALLEEAAQYAQTAGRAHRFKIENLPGLWVVANHDQLLRVLRNLLDNAFKYTPAGGSVVLRSYRDGDEAVFEVMDSGVGITARDLPRVFDRFYRADASRSRRTGGTGLGLAIVRAIAERHGGTVGVNSIPNRGSRFYVRLPLNP